MAVVESKIERGIGVIGRIPSNADSNTIKLVRALDDASFAAYGSAITAVQRVTASRQLQLIERNRTRLESVTGFYLNAIALRRQSRHFDARTVVENLSFEVLNWLTATRLFLDHHLTRFADVYGKDSSETARLKVAISAEYDSSVAYRVLYKLRDYTQHCGFPVDQITVTARDPMKDDWSAVVELTAGRDTLLSEFDWKARVRSDLQQMPERIDILRLVREASPCFRRIFAEITRIRLEGLGDAVRELQEIVSICSSEPEGHPHLLAFQLDDDLNPSEVNVRRVPTELVSWIEGSIGPEEYMRQLSETTESAEPSELAAPSQLDKRTQDSIRVGVGVLNAYFENGGVNPRFADAVNGIADDMGDITPVIVGTTTVAAVGMSMAAAALGTNARDIAGGLVAPATVHEDDE
jgi:hypothetical protein